MKKVRRLNVWAIPVVAVGIGVFIVPEIAFAQLDPRSGSVLSALEREIRGLFDAVAPSVVTIRSACKESGTPSRPGPSSLSVGSGIIMDSGGLILTNARVVYNSDEHWVETYDERIFPAELVGVNGDVAVLRIDASGLRPPEFGDAAELDVGSFIAAIGNSYGFACGLSWGEVNGFRPDGTVQLSLGVPAGSSGGAIVDTRGRVVGLIKAKVSEPYYLDVSMPSSSGSSGYLHRSQRLDLPTSSLSLATPIGHALHIARNLSGSGGSGSAYVGVYIDDLTGWQVEHFKTKTGVLVVGVVSGSPAERYGLAAGDIVLSVGAEPVANVRRFRQVIVQTQPGERLVFNLLRDGQPLKLALETTRADIIDLNAPLDPATGVLARSGTSEAYESQPANAAWVPSTESYRSLEVASPDGVPKGDLEVRLRQLERAVDSLQREIQALLHPAKQ